MIGGWPGPKILPRASLSPPPPARPPGLWDRINRWLAGAPLLTDQPPQLVALHFRKCRQLICLLKAHSLPSPSELTGLKCLA